MHSSAVRQCLIAFITRLQTHNLSTFMNAFSSLCVGSFLKIAVNYIASLICFWSCPFLPMFSFQEFIHVQMTYSFKCREKYNATYYPGIIDDRIPLEESSFLFQVVNVPSAMPFVI